MHIQLDQQQIADFQQWEKTSLNDLPGRYSMGFQGSPVFSICDDDTPTASSEITFSHHDRHLELICNTPVPGPNITVSGMSRAIIEELLNAFDGRTCFADACSRLSIPLPRAQLRLLCQALLGRAVFLADTVQGLEQRIRRAEIVRFPVQSPYLILREYWTNCADVRAAIPELMDNLHSLPAFKSSLADLHIFATMGRDLKTFYGGSGRVATIPGGYREHPMRTGLSSDKDCFIEAYLQKTGLGILRREDRFVFSENKTLLGYVADHGLTFRHPPPENRCLDQILDEMRLALSEVRRSSADGNEQNVVMPLSRFHKLFLHAHPFYNINNSVAMNIVNFSLLRTGSGVIPHLLLDFIALRTEFDEYARVFAKAVEDYAFTGDGWEQEDRVLARIAAYHADLQSGSESDAGT